jgi:nitrous oxidase accessory protein
LSSRLPPARSHGARRGDIVRQAETIVIRSGAAGVLLAAGILSAAAATAQQVIHVSNGGTFTSIGAAVRAAPPHSRIEIENGTYREPTIVVDKPLEIIGKGLPLLDGENLRAIIVIKSDGVTLRGLHLTRAATSYVKDIAAIRVENSNGCVIRDNRIDDSFFGIYLAKSNDCVIERNVIRSNRRSEMTAGNGIHLWASSRNLIASNVVSGHRDGIYFEFVHNSVIRGNVSERNIRYGLHFMYSDDCRYLGNTFRGNGSVVAVMFTHRVEMTGNRFEGNRGSASYGLLLKEISDSKLSHNVFARNTTGLFADGADRLVADGNDFVENGWAMQLDASSQGARFTGNNYIGNTFDVASNSSETSSTFSDNYWDGYRGIDLDKNGVGDIPYHPVRLFSMIVARNRPALILLRSTFAGLLDKAEELLPVLTPSTLADARPAMRRRQ